jgi:acyl transferase domain-containing protein/NAD(P)H-dependent flavin oxidoreductase YrpB (nitropropane dioxygenase family)/NAD(P)-dependent dehydrogenase (short-subunit alcohol dehydrogenase family)
MKRLKKQFVLAACIRTDGSNSKRLRNWRNRSFTCIYDFEDIPDSHLWKPCLRRVGKEAGTFVQNLGIRLMIDDMQDFDRLVADNLSLKVGTMILAIPQQQIASTMIDHARRMAERVFVEVYTEDMVTQSLPFKPDGFVIRGNEAGGICSNMSNPAMLRRIRKKTSLPIWIYGGIGLQSALAYAIGGADGVILSDCLLLIDELAHDLTEQDRRALNTGIRTQAVDIGNGLHLRIGESYPELINRMKALCAAHDRAQFERRNRTDTRLSDVLDVMKQYRTTASCFMGEEAAWAAEFGRRYATIPDVMQALKRVMRDQHDVLSRNYPLARGNALSKELKTEFPIMQGPMTHVSDSPDFLAHVAENGAVPFAALALSKGEKLEALMRETRAKVDGKPWGVGLLGFAPKTLQEEQTALIQKYRPDIAIVAGGRPAHYQTLKRIGTLPFLHIPVPSMIPTFFNEGVRHFIFEGRGCGGHIGPINSFSLWQSALIAFQQLAAAGEDLSDVRIAFAGGIYDAPSAAMTSAFCVPLLEQGVQFGFIVGTAYLFTREIRESAAITPAFQQVALESDQTAILETRAGHAIRCAPTALTSACYREKADLLGQGMAPAEVHQRLEKIYIGRLRLAAKGVKRAGVSNGDEALVTVNETDQMKEGLFMIGEAAALLDHVMGMADLHRSLCSDAVQALRDSHARFSFGKTFAKPTVEARPTDIAVIGMSILAPGSNNLDKFWHNILAQLCCIGEVPEERWQPSVNFHPDPDNPDTTYSTKGGFLADIPINCMEYGIPPGSVPHIDPTQLLALEAVKQALIDAGYGKKEFDRTRTSVFFGFAGGGDLLLAYTVRAALKEYLHRAADIPDAIRERVVRSLNEVLPEWTEDSFPGILGNVITGRVANRFNLNGLNFTVDAACASSMAALQVACQELAYGGTQTAIVGGVDASQHMLGYLCFSKSKALSRSGQSKPFSPEADGIVLGEGIGIVVLKRLADAIDDADRIYAVIKGIGGASDGKGSGMTVPLSRGQELAIDRACEVAGFTTDTVELFEAHGTGTPLGDRVELETIHNVRQNHGANQPCAIGSIKAAIGHTKGAAGVIGVIKAALALHHKVLPAQVNADTIHPAVSGPQTQLYLNTKTRPWFCKTAQHPRRAGVSAFGFGGTNFHTVLEAYDAGAMDPAELPRCLWPAELFLFGAPNIPSLINRINAAIDFMDQMDKPDASLTGFAYRHYLSHVPSAAMPARFAVKAHSLEELRKKLHQSKQLMANGALQPGTQDAKNALRMADGIWGSLVEAPVGPLTALFPGQGSQKLHMLRELAVVFPMVRECLEHANAVLADDFFSIDHGVLTDYMYPPNHENAEEKKQAQSALTQTQIAQPALAAVEMALVYLLAQFNVQTAMAAGHSFGELTALWSAGVMTDRQLLTLAGKRGRCMAAASKVSTGMVAVHIDRNAMSEFVDTVPELTIANHNTPEQVVVSGSMDALERLKVHCRQQQWRYTRLPVSQGFHSPHMAHAAAQWQHDLSSHQFHPPHFPVYANMTAKPYGRSVADIAGILEHHLQNGVAFVEQIEAMYADGARTFLEIGPGSTLINFISAILTDKPHHAIAVQPREEASGIDMLLDCLAALHACGYPVDLRPAYACRKIKTEEKTNQRPSATLFLVNGGRAKPSVELKARKTKKANPSDWESLSQFSSSPFRTASNPHTESEPSLVATALQSGHTRGTADSGHPPPSTRQGSAAGDKAYAPTAAQSPINHQERVQQLKHFQKSISQFLETQERFQRKRLEMMERMWNVNQQLVQNLLGSAHATTMSASTDMGSEKETGRDTLNDRAFPDAAEAPADRALSNSENFASPTSSALPKIDTGRDDSFRPSDKSVQNTSVDYRSLLFEIIAERTQYPVEMLALEQDIEADLGIDSIKRVEIITMLRETHPSLSDIADETYYEAMAQLKTLGDVVAWIDRTFGPSHIESHTKAEGRQAVSQTPLSTDASSEPDYRSLLFDVISERTQYPVEMLALEQDIEADLGIDSIKRVEIITMLRETHPSLSDIADEAYYEEMAQLRTLGEVVEWIDDTFGMPGAHDRIPSELPTEKTAGDRKAIPPVGKVNGGQRLMDIISEKTRYPVELIDMDLDLEEDLGMDTSQVIEIMLKCNKSPLLPSEIQPGRLGRIAQRLKTVQDLVHWMAQASASNGGNDTSGIADALEISTDVEPTETSLFRRYGLTLIEQPLAAGQPRSLPGALMLLDGGHALGRQIQSDAEKQGIRCVRVMHYANGHVENQDSIHLNARQEQDYETCYHRLKTDHGTPCGVLNLLSLGKHSHEESDQALMHSFLWAKTMGADPDLRQDKRWNLFWVSVTGMGGDFGLNQAMDFEATQNGLHGITKCLYHEWPGLQAKTIDIHPEENTEQLSRLVLDECFATHDTITEIGFPNQTRHALALTDLPHDLGDTQPRLNRDSVLLITGGAKGIASEAALLLAKRYQPTMILVGRTPLPERSPDELAAFVSRAKMGEQDPKELKSRIIKELMSSTEHVAPALVNDRYEAIMKEYKIRQSIEKMEQLHAKVFYHACDCTDDHDFSRLIRQTYKTFQRIDGVVHAAGCLKDAFITQKSTEHFKQVLDTKVKGARILLRELDFETLDFLLFFSSVSGRFGNRGQADYAAANEILNKMAVKIHHQWPGKAVAVNWGPWEGDGMVSSQLKEQFMKAGVYLLPRDLGAEMFNREINAVHRVSEVVIFGAADIENRLPIVGRQTLSADCGQPLPFVQLFKMKHQPAGNSFCWQLDLDRSAPYLNDHRIDEVPVLAAAMAMEIMAQAGLAAGPAFRFKGIQKFDLYKGIMAESDHPLTLTIKADMHQNGSPDELIADVHLTLPNQISRSNYTCQVLLGKAGHDPIPALMHLTHSQRFRHSVEKIYENRLFHKGVFRALKRIESFEIADLKNSGIKGIIEPSIPERVIGDGVGGLWLIDPVVFDCAYQLALLWVQERYSTMALPSSIKLYRRYRSYNGGPIHCEVAIKNTQFPLLLMDFMFTDERGDLYAKATDVAALMSRGLNERLSVRQSKLATIHS